MLYFEKRMKLLRTRNRLMKEKAEIERKLSVIHNIVETLKFMDRLRPVKRRIKWTN